ncbi:MAG: hypothetical protein IMF11_14745 [Proteobacteria bacterium]|nr:hypothetical protein [Pseudomonadota bacterium]
MKKLIAVAAMLSVLCFGFGTSHALIGVPDDVAATDVLIPWIYVSMPGFGNENTLITVTEVNGFGPPNTTLMGWVNDIDSVQVFNFGAELTPFDVWITDGLTLINLMPPLAQQALEIDVDGDGVNDHWAGYVYLYNLNYLQNLMSHVYQVYLPAGMAASIKGVGMECFDPNYAALQYQTNGVDAIPFSTFGWMDEAFSAHALWVGEWFLSFAPAAPPAPVVNPILPIVADNVNNFRLMPRFFVNDDQGENLLMIWTETFYTGVLPPGNVHCNFWDQDEFGLSANIPIDHELNIIRLRDVLPAGLFAGVYPYGGWIDIRTPDIFNAGIISPQWNFDWNFNGVTDGAERPWLVYSWQRAYGPAAEAWEVIHAADRQVN